MDSIDDQRLEIMYNLQPLSTTKRGLSCFHHRKSEKEAVKKEVEKKEGWMDSINDQPAKMLENISTNTCTSKI
jgi:hypothetical protein